MNFNKLANTLIENIDPSIANDATNEEYEGRAPNPEFQKWKAENPGVPTYKFFKMQRDKKLGGDVETSTKEPIETDEVGSMSASELKTQAAIESFMSEHPDASVSDIVDHLKGLNDQGISLKTSYVTNAEEIDRMVTKLKEMEASEKPLDLADPSGSDIDAEKKAKFARLRKFMSMSRGERDAYLASKGKFSSEDEKDKEDSEDEEEETDPYVKSYLKGMKRDDEEEPEFDEIDKN